MRTTRLSIPIALACVAGACHRSPPQVALAPVDSSALQRAREDSISRAEAEARARDAAERRAAQRRADSLAELERRSQDLKAVLATLIHFDFDKATIRSGDAGVLEEKLSILRANPQVRVQIAGNCDERGSDEYNLALGNRRAITAKQYLVAHGVDASRIETVSYGKEKPLDSAHNEMAWAKNRNDQFELLGSNVVLKQP
ncbi:MAG TPA: peptidoglycan-associated lipoprotein Pal [Gemmatimonadales bacterium]|nr:peptidoglycan-associated lipoprotein Pal [Gemmatimonadales bacterium]